MSSSSLATLLLLFTAAHADGSTSRARHFPLPPSAIVHLGASGADSSDPEASICSSSLHFTPGQVARMFRTYHLLQSGEMHSSYDIAPCWQNGTILFQGQTFTFRINPLNTLTTTFPDGKEKQLGGRASGKLNGK
jgi:hypothetical protein